MRILAIDPSTTCTGWAVIADGRILASGSTRGKGRKDLAERMEEMGEAILCGYLAACPKTSPDIIVIETPSRKGTTYQRRQLLGGVVTYAFWSGILGGMLRGAIGTAATTRHVYVPADEWTRSTPKERRLARLRAEGHKFGTDDEGDAIALALWYAEQERLRSLESRIIATSAGGPSRTGVEG